MSASWRMLGPWWRERAGRRRGKATWSRANLGSRGCGPCWHVHVNSPDPTVGAPDRATGRRPAVRGLVLCSGLPLALLLMALEQRLLANGTLNTKDLPPIVGNEQGTLGEYLLNVWHWDAAIFGLLLVSIPCLWFGVRSLLAGRAVTSRRP